MAVTTQSRVAPFGAITAFRAVQKLEGVKSNIVAWYLARQTENALNKLSARELDDLGISRGEIREIAERAAAR